jgi:predicted transcriptional regulator of viral defense system
MPRSLSAVESRLMERLEWDKKPIITIEEAMTILDCSYEYARQVLRRLADNAWLARITPGTYEVIPAERGAHAFVDTNPLFIGSTLVTPYYFSYATAAFFHGLSTQAAATVYVATPKRVWRRLVTVRDKEYRLVYQPAHKYFGSVEVDAYGSAVMMANPEKTIIDSLDRPAYSGDIPEIAGMISRGKTRLDWQILADYALRFRSQALLQRLGFLADLLEVPLGTETRTRILGAVGRSYPYLGAPSRWGTGGDYNSIWRVVDNVPRDRLLAEIEVR